MSSVVTGGIKENLGQYCRGDANKQAWAPVLKCSQRTKSCGNSVDCRKRSSKRCFSLTILALLRLLFAFVFSYKPGRPVKVKADSAFFPQDDFCSLHLGFLCVSLPPLFICCVLKTGYQRLQLKSFLQNISPTCTPFIQHSLPLTAKSINHSPGIGAESLSLDKKNTVKEQSK